MDLLKIIKEAEKEGRAVPHFNISNFEQLKAISNVGEKLRIPIVIGVSEGERDYIGALQVFDLVKSFNESYGTSKFRLFLNADHTHSLERVKEAAELGYDSIVVDGSAMSFEENIEFTRTAVKAAKAIAKKNKRTILIEGEVGNIGSGSQIRKELPKGAESKSEDLTKPEDALRFVKETEVDMLAPAVGNLHGMFKDAPEPNLDIPRIKAIRIIAKVPLTLHGGSGNTPSDFRDAIKAGISLIHISTELRVAWKTGMEKGLRENPNEVSPYKLSESAINEMEKVVGEKVKLFGW